jgi:hypothetical protein
MKGKARHAKRAGLFIFCYNNFMSKIKTILFILMLVIGLYLIISGEKSQTVVNNPQYSFEEVPIVQEETLNINIWADNAIEKSPFYEIKYDLSGISDENVKTDIERYITTRISQFKTDGNFQNLSEADKEFLGFNDGFRYTLEFTFDTKDSGKIKTYLIKVASFTGGAHGNLEILSFNYDKNLEKRLSLNDVFRRPAPVYLQKLGEIGKEFLEEKYSDVAFYEGLAPQPYNWATWYVSDDSLVFVFQPYQVVPWAYGTPELKIHKNQISEFLNLDYFIN